MKSPHILLTLVLFVVSSTTLYSQDTGLFEYPEPQTITLTERQQELQENAKSREYLKRIDLVRINNIQALKERSSLTLNLPGERTVAVQQNELRTRSERQFTWSGTMSEPAATTKLIVTEKGVTGWIRSTKYYFMIEPLGDGLHLLTEVDPSQFPQELPPLESEEKENGGETNEGSKPKGAAGLMTSPEVDVLVVYTSQASSQSGDIEAVIYGGEDVTNQSFGNSNVSASVNVVHTAQINYTESGDISDDLCRLTGSSTFTPSTCSGVSNLSAMDNVHSLRNQYGADLVVLLVNSGGAGVGWLRSTVSYGFTVVRWDLAVGNYTFAHEIGHNLGAAHDRDNGNNPYFQYGHGYRYTPANWHTIMSYPPGDRINYWSNPDKYLGGVAMGTAQYEDNARVWDERAATVAGFKSTGPSVYISGPGHIPSGASATYYANVSGGVSPYDYQWYKNGSPVGTNSSSYQLNTYPSDEGIIIVSVTVTDDNNNSDSDDYQVFIDPNKKIVAAPTPQEYNLSASYPNPFNPSTQISYQLPEQSSVTLEVFDVMGRKVATLVNTNQAPGTYAERFNASGLSSGLYIARINAIGNSGEAFSKELKMQLVK